MWLWYQAQSLYLICQIHWITHAAIAHRYQKVLVAVQGLLGQWIMLIACHGMDGENVTANSSDSYSGISLQSKHWNNFLF